MPSNPALLIIWAVLGLIIGGTMYFIVGGNPYIHMVIGAVAGIAGGAMASRRKQ